MGEALKTKQGIVGKLEFKKFHPSGSLGSRLKSVEDLMLVGKKIPFIPGNLF